MSPVGSHRRDKGRMNLSKKIFKILWLTMNIKIFYLKNDK